MNSQIILLVEDNPSDIELTRRALVRNCISNELTVVRDGQEALDFLFGQGALRRQPGAAMPALVLLDLKLPRVSGLEVLQQMRTAPSTRRLPVVILSSSNEEQDMAACYDLGANSYVRKPVDFTQFAESIKQLATYWLDINEPPPPVR
ncbi:MAG: response regulator [Chloroflexi bacterium]|nr:response regulator [Chloroflexota bacterium]